MTQVTEKKKKERNIFKSSLKLMLHLVNNLVSVLFVYSLIVFLVYLVGNYQEFTDQVQLFILSVLSVSSALLAIVSFTGCILYLINIFTGKFEKLSILFFIFLAAGILIGIFFLLYTVIIKKLSLGL